MQVIFDFDGTLVDSIDVLIECADALANDYCYMPIKNREVVAALSLRQLVEDRLGIAREKLPAWQADFRQQLAQRRHKITLINDVDWLLQGISARNWSSYLVSSAPEEYLMHLIGGCGSYFTEIYADVPLGAKESTLEKIIANGFSSSEVVVYVGDETSDLASCHCVGIPMIGVSWGLNSREVLLSSGASHMISGLKELLPYLEQMQHL